MLDRKSQSLDLQAVSFAEQAIEINAQGMGGQFGQQPSTQTPKGVGVIDLDIELLDQLAVNGFDNLADSIKGLADSRGMCSAGSAAVSLMRYRLESQEAECQLGSKG